MVQVHTKSIIREMIKFKIGNDNATWRRVWGKTLDKEVKKTRVETLGS